MRAPINPWRTVVITVGATVAVWLIVMGWYSFFWPRIMPLPYTQTDKSFYHGVYDVESTDDGVRYHWMAAESRLDIPRLTWTPMMIVDMVVLDSARPLTIQIDTTAISITTTRRIQLLIAQPHPWHTSVSVQAPALQIPSDARSLGVRIARVQLHRVGENVPAPIWFVLVAVLVVMCAITTGVLGLSPRFIWLCLAMVPVLVVWMITREPSYATAWLQGLAMTSGTVPVVLVVLRRMLPSLPWGVLIAVTVAVLIRLIAVTYPGFEGHDYLIHAKRLVYMMHHQQVTVLDYPYEFNRRPALIVPLFYALTYLFQPLFGMSLAMHLIAVWAETLVAVCMWMLFTRWQVAPRVVTLATIVLLAMPLSSAVLWWAFFPQIVAHLCLFGMMMSVARRDMRGAWWAGVWCMAIAWSHIGEVLIAALWYICVRLYEADRWTRAWWMRWVPIATLPLTALLVYVPYVQLLLSQPPTPATAPVAALYDRLAQIKEAFAVGFAPFPWWLFPVLWAIVWYRAPLATRPWIVATVIWLVVELVSAYQVRYIYFAIPLIALGMSMMLQPLWQRHWAGRTFVVTIVAFVVWISVAHWYDATLLLYRMRVDGLTH